VNAYRFFVLFTLFFVGFYFLLDYLQNNVFDQYDLYFSSFSITFFLYISSTVVCLTTYYVNKKFSDKVGFVFLGISILKIIATVIFLIPFLKSGIENKMPTVLCFFAFYFIVLLIETIAVVELINKK